MTDTNDSPIERFLRRAEAAQYITKTFGFSCSPKWLAKLACVCSDGPPFRHAGRVPLYARADLDAWALNRIGPLVRSTSDVADRRGDERRQRGNVERRPPARRNHRPEPKARPRKARQPGRK